MINFKIGTFSPQIEKSGQKVPYLLAGVAGAIALHALIKCQFASLGFASAAAVTFGALHNRTTYLQKGIAEKTPKITELEGKKLADQIQSKNSELAEAKKNLELLDATFKSTIQERIAEVRLNHSTINGLEAAVNKPPSVLQLVEEQFEFPAIEGLAATALVPSEKPLPDRINNKALYALALLTLALAAHSLIKTKDSRLLIGTGSFSLASLAFHSRSVYQSLLEKEAELATISSAYDSSTLQLVDLDKQIAHFEEQRKQHLALGLKYMEELVAQVKAQANTIENLEAQLQALKQKEPIPEPDLLGSMIVMDVVPSELREEYKPYAPKILSKEESALALKDYVAVHGNGRSLEEVQELIKEGFRLLVEMHQNETNMNQAGWTAILWALQYRAIERQQGFVRGTFIIKNGKTIFKHLYEKTAGSYDKISSSHEVERTIVKEENGKQLKQLSRFDFNAPSYADHSTILGQLISGYKGSQDMLLKPEEHGFTGFKAIFGHTVNYGQSLIRRAKGEEDKSDERRERLPASLLKEFSTLIEVLSPEDIEGAYSNAQVYGIAFMYDALTKINLNAINPVKVNQVTNLLKKITSFDHCDLRKGNEVFFTLEEILQPYYLDQFCDELKMTPENRSASLQRFQTWSSAHYEDQHQAFLQFLIEEYKAIHCDFFKNGCKGVVEAEHVIGSGLAQWQKDIEGMRVPTLIINRTTLPKEGSKDFYNNVVKRAMQGFSNHEASLIKQYAHQCLITNVIADKKIVDKYPQIPSLMTVGFKQTTDWSLSINWLDETKSAIEISAGAVYPITANAVELGFGRDVVMKQMKLTTKITITPSTNEVSAAMFTLEPID